MSLIGRVRWASVAGLIAVVLAAGAVFPAMAKDPLATAAVPALPEPLTKEAVRELVSRLSDDEVRRLLLDQLDRAAAAEPVTSKAGKGMSRDLAADYGKRIGNYKEKIERYEKEKEEIKKKAEDLEKRRDDSQLHSGAFGMAAMFLQIAILLSSIAALMKKKLFWFIGMGAGCFGLLYFFNGFFLFMK